MRVRTWLPLSLAGVLALAVLGLGQGGRPAKGRTLADLVPGNALSVLSFRPPELLAAPAVKALLPLAGEGGKEFAAGFEREFGVPLDKVQRAVIVHMPAAGADQAV